MYELKTALRLLTIDTFITLSFYPPSPICLWMVSQQYVNETMNTRLIIWISGTKEEPKKDKTTVTTEQKNAAPTVRTENKNQAPTVTTKNKIQAPTFTTETKKVTTTDDVAERQQQDNTEGASVVSSDTNIVLLSVAGSLFLAQAL